MQERNLSQQIRTKIAIIGAGPAGSTLSLFLSKKKIAHVLIEKEAFPRDKICGDGITAEAYRALRKYSEELYQEFLQLDWVEHSKGFHIELANQKSIEFDFSSDLEKPYIVCVAKRNLFDNWLFSKTKSIYQNCLLGYAVTDIKRENNKVQITCSKQGSELQIECDVVVGADGERSIVRKTFHPNSIHKNREHHTASIRQYYKGVSRSYNTPLEFYQVSFTHRSYFWIFHLPNNECNVGFGALSSDVSANKINLRKEMLDFMQSHPVLSLRFKKAEALGSIEGWGIPLNSDAFDFVGDNYVLVGDAAKFAEPLTGKGIGVAMLAAMHLSDVLEKAVQKNNFSKEVLLEFEKNIHAIFAKQWKQLRIMQKNTRIKWLMNLSFFALSQKWIKNYLQKRYVKNFMRYLNNSISK